MLKINWSPGLSCSVLLPKQQNNVTNEQFPSSCIMFLDIEQNGEDCVVLHRLDRSMAIHGAGGSAFLAAQEGKLQNARRIAPEWTQYDNELQAIIDKIQ